ncbi:toll/interleukin-1 receptor domain-containing protein [Streptomyces sp. NPDC005897]|uniref:toll/interleukin-1 receptor domain-containing protein n=1 Tax=Streptomyces sp. NPDC005897 TaxID=3157081 RepID=UPI003411B150
MPTVFVSHSAKGDPIATAVQQSLVRGLRARNYAVRIDTDALRPGQDWCPLLFHWLGECDAAVVLLNAKALTSFWVRREVNILMWRRALNPSFRVVPVLVGQVSSKDVQDAGFSDVLPVECARITSAPSGRSTGEAADEDFDGELDSLAAGVLKEFADLPHNSRDSDDMRRWISRIAAFLRRAGDLQALKGAARMLGITGEDLRHVESQVGSCEFLAHQLLGTADARLVGALMELGPHLGMDALEQLVIQVRPTWINGESARHLLPPAAPDRRTIALNASYPETADSYVARAVCLRLDRYYMKAAGGIPLGEDAAQELTEQCMDAVRQLLNYRPGTPVSAFRPRPGGAWQYLTIAVHGVRPALVAQVVQELHVRFPWLLIVLLTGLVMPDEETLRSWCVDDLVVVTPYLDEDEEIEGDRLSRDLSGIVGRLNGSRRL